MYWSPNKYLETPYQGTLANMLPLLLESPYLVESAKESYARLIVEGGVEPLSEAICKRNYGGEPVCIYKVFESLYGLDEPLHKMVTQYFLAAAENGEADRQILLLVGGPGTAKTDISHILFYLKMMSAPVPYPMFCRHHCNSLSLINWLPHEVAQQAARKGGTVQKHLEDILESLHLQRLIQWDLLEECKPEVYAKIKGKTLKALAALKPNDLADAIVFGLGLSEATRANIGKPCPDCRARVLGLFEEPVSIADMPMSNLIFKPRDGLIDLPLVDRLNPKLEQWTGWEDLIISQGGLRPLRENDPRDIGEVDPQVVTWQGKVVRAHRGLLVLQEGTDIPEEMASVFIELTQGKIVEVPHLGNVSVDCATMLTANFEQAEMFYGDEANKRYADRTKEIRIPYPASVKAQMGISAKFNKMTSWGRPLKYGGFHQCPLLEMATAQFRAYSTMVKSGSLTLAQQAAIVDGFRVVRPSGSIVIPTPEEVRRTTSPLTGSKGASPRFSSKVLEPLFAQARLIGKNCVTTGAFIKRLKLELSTMRNREEGEAWLKVVQEEIDPWYRTMISRMALAACTLNIEALAQPISDAYFDNVVHLVDVEPYDTDAIKKVEADDYFGISDAEAHAFHEEVYAVLARFRKVNGHNHIPLRQVPFRLRRCLERLALKGDTGAMGRPSDTTCSAQEYERRLQYLIDHENCCRECGGQILLDASRPGEVQLP